MIKQNGRISTYEESDMKIWKQNFAYLVKSQKPECWANCALEMIITFFIQPPAYIAKAKKYQAALAGETLHVMRKPDLDN